MEFLANLSIGGMPCTEEEIANLEHLFSNYKLPRAYTEFLISAGKFESRLVGETCFYDDLFLLKTGAIKILEDDKSALALNQEDFVFFSSQGCLFAFFKLNEGDNPPVYSYIEGSAQSEFFKEANSFSDFLLKYFNSDPLLFNKK